MRKITLLMALLPACSNLQEVEPFESENSQPTIQFKQGFSNSQEFQVKASAINDNLLTAVDYQLFEDLNHDGQASPEDLIWGWFNASFAASKTDLSTIRIRPGILPATLHMTAKIESLEGTHHRVWKLQVANLGL